MSYFSVVGDRERDWLMPVQRRSPIYTMISIREKMMTPKEQKESSMILLMQERSKSEFHNKITNTQKNIFDIKPKFFFEQPVKIIF
jgi:hypothetical protein